MTGSFTHAVFALLLTGLLAVSPAAHEQSGSHCIQARWDKDCQYLSASSCRNKESYLYFTNNCDTQVSVFYCTEQARQGLGRASCGDGKVYYTHVTVLDPQETKERFLIKQGTDFEYAACHGFYNNWNDNKGPDGRQFYADKTTGNFTCGTPTTDR